MNRRLFFAMLAGLPLVSRLAPTWSSRMLRMGDTFTIEGVLGAFVVSRDVVAHQAPIDWDRAHADWQRDPPVDWDSAR